MTNSSVSHSLPESLQVNDGAQKLTTPTALHLDIVESVDNARHIIAIDPGLVCGIAVLTFAQSDDLDGGFAATLSSNELPWLEAVSYVTKWTRSEPASYINIVSERYTIPTGRSVVTAQLEAIKTNGALEYVASQWDVTFALQPRAEVKKIVTDAILKKLGWFIKTKDGHANDAARHAGFSLFSYHPVLWLRMTDGI